MTGCYYARCLGCLKMRTIPARSLIESLKVERTRMKYRNKLFRLFVLLLAAVMLLSSCTAGALEIAKRLNCPIP